MITYILKKTLIVLFLFLYFSNYAQRSHPIQKISKVKKAEKKEIIDDIKLKTKSSNFICK